MRDEKKKQRKQKGCDEGHRGKGENEKRSGREKVTLGLMFAEGEVVLKHDEEDKKKEVDGHKCSLNPVLDLADPPTHCT